MRGVFVTPICRGDPAIEVFRGFWLALRAQYLPGKSPNDRVEQ